MTQRYRGARQTGEAATQRLILDWLSAKGIFSLRMNTGAVKLEGRFLRFGVPGCADILAFCPMPVWVEVKQERGRQSELQKSFQAKVESEGHKYILARSLDDVIEAFSP